MNLAPIVDKVPPKQSDIEILCDPSSNVASWFSQTLESVPEDLRESVVFQLHKALLQLRSRSYTSVMHRKLSFGSLDDIVVGLKPAPRHLRTCKAALRANRHPILVVPEYSLDRARHLRQSAALEAKVQIVTFEALFAIGIIFAAMEHRRSIPDMWATLISEYNVGMHDMSRPNLILRWSTQ
jgi:hypothetical protein